MARHTSVLPIAIYSVGVGGRSAVITCSQQFWALRSVRAKLQTPLAGTSQRYDGALSAAAPSASCLLSSYMEIMIPSLRAAIDDPASFIVGEQKDLILSAMLCLGGICRVLQSGKLGLFVPERLSSKGSCRCFSANLPPPKIHHAVVKILVSGGP